MLPPLLAFGLTVLFQAVANDLSVVEERYEKEYVDHCRFLAALKQGNPNKVKRIFRVILRQYLQRTLEDAKAEAASAAGQGCAGSEPPTGCSDPTGFEAGNEPPAAGHWSVRSMAKIPGRQPGNRPAYLGCLRKAD